jgi:hypothetical protein
MSSFQEASQKIITSAKAEVDAFMTHAVLAAGLKAIADGQAPVPQLPVPDGTEGQDRRTYPDTEDK